MTEEQRIIRNQKAKEYRRTKNGLIIKIYNSQLRSSKKRNHEKPKYTLEELKKWFYKQHNFDELYINWVNSNYDKKLTPSCDRINNYKGYSFDNIRLVTWYENKNELNKDTSLIFIPKFNIKGYPDFYFCTENKLHNTRTNRILKKRVKCCSIGYELSGKFITIKNIEKLKYNIQTRSKNCNFAQNNVLKNEKL